MNEKKTGIVYCKKHNRKENFERVKFDFLGFSFQPRFTSSKRSTRMFLGYDCAISRKSENKITEIFRNSKFHRWTGVDISRIAEIFNPKIRGWINYYGKCRLHELMRIFKVFHLRLLKWACNRYKRHKRGIRRAKRWLRNLFRLNPGLFVHWQYGFQYA